MQWTADPSHSSVEFGVRHLGLSTVRGRFREFTAQVELDEQGEPQSIAAEIVAASIDTGVKQRDQHLRSPDFFDAERYPEIAFHATAIEPAGENRYRVTGDLTMHGVSAPVTLELETTDEMRDPWGNHRVAGSLSGKLSRKAWGLTWNQVLEFGGFAVSDEVKLEINVQVVAPQEATV